MIEPGSEGRVLFLALGAIAILVLTLAVVRRASPGVGPSASTSTSRRERWLVVALVLVANAPLLTLGPWSHPEATFGDAVTHARVAEEIAHTGLPHAWIDAYLAGFPFAEHYPPLAWTVVAAWIAIGVSPLHATHLLGWLALLATPLALYVALVRCAVRPPIALVGACFVSWLAPRTAFAGGYETFFGLGLLSQVVALPWSILTASYVARARSAWPSVVLGSVAMIAHPQLAVAATCVQTIAALASGRRDVVERAVRAALGAAGVAIALYGPGVLALRVPFGWPSDLGWQQLGLEPRHVIGWIRDAELLDVGRAAALTDVSLLALLGLVVQSRDGLARTALSALLAAAVLALGGHALDAIPVARGLLSVLQPLRALALVPVLLAVGLAVAISLATPHVETLLASRPRLARATPWLVGVGVIALLSPAWRERARYAADVGDELVARRGRPCGRHTPSDYDGAALATSLARLEGGRLWYALDDAPAAYCMNDGALTLASSVSIATTVAVGAHVGVEHDLFAALDPHRAGVSRRAAAIGVRFVLASRPPTDGWRPLTSGELALYESPTPTSSIGVGCIRDRWRGSDAVVRAQIRRALDDPDRTDALLDPEALLEWEITTGPLEVSRIEARCSIDGATVRQVRREPGALKAHVSLRAPSQVVLRVTDHPGWVVQVDGERVPTRLVSPGFPAVDVGPGEHRIVAEARGTSARAMCSVVGAVCVAAAGGLRRRRRDDVPLLRRLV